MKNNKHLIIRPRQLALTLGVSRTTIWRWTRKGFLPPPIILGPRLIGWRQIDIENWLNSQIMEAA